jgi:cytochrome c peroxidase
MKKMPLLFSFLLGGALLSGWIQFFFPLPDQEPEELVVPLGLPPIAWPKDNLYEKRKADLGQLLYFDKRLSSDGTISCASCHSVKRAFSDGKPVSDGIGGQKGNRHSPTVINAAYQTTLFWDGRAQTLEEQCKGPLANPKEMTIEQDIHKAYQQCQERITSLEGYREWFQEIFGSSECSIDNIAKAIATFERTVLSGNSPYDRYMAGDASAMTEQQIRGYQIFQTVGCAVCHAGPNFTTDSFANIGIGMDVENPDLGRFDVTHAEKDWGAFKVPTLREVANTHPYMHDGSLKTLREVVDYYDRGGIPNQNLDPLMRPLHLSEEDKEALVSFLEALSGEGWQHFKAPDSFP